MGKEDLVVSDLIKYLSPHYISDFECYKDGKKITISENELLGIK
jgi:hypothetical protein